MGGDDRKITVGGRNCKRGHAAWYCLHDMMQDDLTYGREARGISESTSQVLRDPIERSCRRIVVIRTNRKTVRQLAEHQRTRGPVSLDHEDERGRGLAARAGHAS